MVPTHPIADTPRLSQPERVFRALLRPMDAEDKIDGVRPVGRAMRGLTAVAAAVHGGHEEEQEGEEGEEGWQLRRHKCAL